MSRFSLAPPSVFRWRATENTRQLLIMQALGPESLRTIGSAIKLPPFHKVQTEREALALVDITVNDPSTYEPIMKIINDLPPARSWGLYLNSGFHAVSTHTDGHREMVQAAIVQFPKTGLDGDIPRVIDVGIGNGNLVIASAIQNPRGIVYGLDIAGSALNISTFRMNEISDIAATKFEDPGLTNTGRFWMGRGSATDPHIFGTQQFDAGAMVLTLFAVPPAQRKTALQNVYKSLKPGARFVLIDPIPRANRPSEGHNFIRDIVRNAFQNNTNLTALDVALLAAKNAHGLLKIEFLEPSEQIALAESVGFKLVSLPQTAYYGMTNMIVLEKPAP